MATYNIPMQMQQRCDTVSNWESYNPILLTGQIGIALDDETSEVVLYKIGDGTTTWNNLTKRVDFTPEEKVALKKFIDAGGGSGGSSVAPSEINGNIINNGEQMVVYDDSQVKDSIESLNNRSVIGRKNDYGYFTLSANQTSGISVNSPVRFDTVKDANNIELDTSTYTAKLNKGKTYKITFQVQGGNTSHASDYYIKDVTNNVRIGQALYDVSMSYNSTSNGGNIIQTIYSPVVDCSVGIFFANRILSSSSGGFPSAIYMEATNLIIEEIGSTLVLDPVEYAQDHDVNASTFGLTSNKTVTADTPVVFDTSNGGVELSNDGYAQLKKDTTYVFSASIYNKSNPVMQTGIRVYDVTNKHDIAYLGVGGHSTGTVKYKTTEDIKVSIVVGTSITLYPNYTYLTVQEIKNPVVVEYTNLKEISNPLMSSQISQEAPIGTVISYMGINTPEHYLCCDGSIYNISDYPELFDKIGNQFGGDGITTFAVPFYISLTENTKDITPTMTSNTTPSPYVVSASSIYSTLLEPWKAFDGDIVANSWGTASVTGWIKLDFSVITPISSFSVGSYSGGSINSVFPKNFTLYGSNDDVIYNSVVSVTDQTNWAFGSNSEVRTYKIGKVVKYRYYRLNIEANNGYGYSAIGSLRFLIHSFKYIKYEATHYAINQYGGFQEDILFEGNVSVNNTVCELSYNYNEYDNIYIECSWTNVINLIPVRVASIDSTKKIGLQVLSIGSVDTTGRGSFPTHNSFKLTDSAGNIVITKILGIKGSIPTIIEGGAL